MEPQQTPEPFKVIIVGGGLAGCLLASGLLRERIDVTVYEALPENSKRDGYQIRLGEYALVGLRTCLDADRLRSIMSKFGRSGASLAHAPLVLDKNFPISQGVHQTNRCLTLKFGKQRLTIIGSNIRCHENFAYTRFFAHIQLMIPKPGCKYTQRPP